MDPQVGFGGPDFVILGVGWHDGQVMVIGSDVPIKAELINRFPTWEDDDWFGFNDYRKPKMSRYFTLTVEFEQYHMAIGPDYQTAMTTLMNAWTPKPKQAKRPAIPNQEAIGQ